jgi:hypothetical protein
MASKMSHENHDWVSSHLREIGVVSIGDRFKIMRFLENLSQHAADHLAMSHRSTLPKQAALLEHPLCQRTYCLVKVMATGHTKTVVRGSGSMEKFHCQKHDFRHDTTENFGEVLALWATSPMYKHAQEDGCVCVCPDEASKKKHEDFHESDFACSVSHHSNCKARSGTLDSSSPFRHHATGRAYNLDCGEASVKTLWHC